MKRVLLLSFILLFYAPRSEAAQTLVFDPMGGATAYEVESSTDDGKSWVIMSPRVLPSACSPTQCTYTVNPGTGRTLYRWAVIYGSTRVLRTDAGVYVCVGISDCPFPGSNIGVK